MNTMFNHFQRLTLGFLFLFIAFGCSSEEKVSSLDERRSYQSGSGTTSLPELTSDSYAGNDFDARNGRSDRNGSEGSESNENDESNESKYIDEKSALRTLSKKGTDERRNR